MSMRTTDVWLYREPTWTSTDLAGFDVEALDGDIVVDTGPWIFGKKVMLPAGVIRDVDLDTEKIFVERTKDEIKNAPEFDEDRYRDSAYRDELGTYYSARSSNPSL